MNNNTGGLAVEVELMARSLPLSPHLKVTGS
jgi:hypothetical protein